MDSDLSIIIFIGFCVLLIIFAFRFFIFCIVEDVKTHNEMKIKELREHNININHNKNED